MENSDDNKSNSVRINDSKAEPKVASALYIPRISVKFEDFKRFFVELNSNNAKCTRIAIKIKGDYYIFNTVQELETYEDVAKYLKSTYLLPVRGFKFKIEFDEGSIYFGETAKIRGNPEWQKKKVDVIINFFAYQYKLGSGKTVPQLFSQLYITIILFLLFVLIFANAYIQFLLNPNIFSHFLDEMFVTPSLFLYAMALTVALLLLSIGVTPVYLSVKISETLESKYLVHLIKTMRSNKNYYGLDFGAILTLLMLFASIMVSLLTANYALIGLPQNGSNPLPEYVYDLEKFLFADFSFLVAAVLGVFSLTLTFPLFIDWYKKRTDIWGESEELF